MKKILMIPARIASNRIPQKNIKPFCGSTLVDIAIEKSKLIFEPNQIWLNSPDECFSKIAQKHKINFYLRDQSLNKTETTNSDFVKDFMQSNDMDILFMLNTTSPLIKKSTIIKFIEEYNKDQCDTMLSVFSEQSPIILDEKPINWSYETHTPSENLKHYSKIVWAISAWKKKVFLSSACGTYAGVKKFFDIPKIEAIDIDTIDDWKIAETIYKIK